MPMTDKELRRLHRDDLLQILINQQTQLDDYAALVEDYERRLNDRRIAIEESGSVAEAALKLNGVFEAAQRAADQYLEETKGRVQSLRDSTDDAIERARRQAEDILKQARAESERIIAGAKREAEDIKALARAESPIPAAAPRAEAEPDGTTRRNKA